MCGQFVRRLPGGDLKPLDFVPVASRDRLRSSALATRDSSGWHHSRPNIGFGSRSQPETALPSCASCWCASAQASIAPRWTFSQSPSGNVLETPQSPQVTVRSSMGHSIHPAGAARAKRSWRLSPILSPNSPSRRLIQRRSPNRRERPLQRLRSFRSLGRACWPLALVWPQCREPSGAFVRQRRHGIGKGRIRQLFVRLPAGYGGVRIKCWSDGVGAGGPGGGRAGQDSSCPWCRTGGPANAGCRRLVVRPARWCAGHPRCGLAAGQPSWPGRDGGIRSGYPPCHPGARPDMAG